MRVCVTIYMGFFGFLYINIVRVPLTIYMGFFAFLNINIFLKLFFYFLLVLESWQQIQLQIKV